MQKLAFSLLLLITCCFLACHENVTMVDCLSCPRDRDTLEPQDRRVILEEFTGVECVGCPAGSTEIENLLSIYGERLIAISIHAGPLSDPYPESQFDFRTEKGTALLGFLGLPNGIPSAVIDRTVFTGEQGLQLVGLSSWGGRVAEQLDKEAKVRLNLENTFDENDRNLKIKIQGGAFEAIPEDVFVTILISESGIVDAQLTPETSPETDPEYIHKHVLRRILTSFDGDILANGLDQGDVFEKTYSFTLPQDWAADKCEIIAFAHVNQSSKEVLQAVEAPVVE